MSLIRTCGHGPFKTTIIDRGFVKGINRHLRTNPILYVIIDRGYRLGVKLIAEGVETEDQYEFLRKRGRIRTRVAISLALAD